MPVRKSGNGMHGGRRRLRRDSVLECVRFRAAFESDMAREVPVSTFPEKPSANSGNPSGLRKRRRSLSITHIFSTRAFKKERRSKVCHPERSPRSEGPRNTPQNVPLSMALSKQTTFLFWAVKTDDGTLLPGFRWG